MPFSFEKHLKELTDLRHRLHAMAELSGHEKKTSEAIATFIENTSPNSMERGVGGHGLFATFNSGDTGPHLLLRCELDALPIPDVNEVDYQSKTEGVGHKCGHDGHMAILCGVAKLLQENPPEAGKVTLLFQPAEETGEGARRVLDDPKFKALEPDYCFALHNLPGFEKDQIIIRDKVFAAASVGMVVNFKGSTAHAAHPEQGRSPALAMAQAVQAFSAAPQFYSPLEKAAKVTVINAQLGERAFGTSPGEATVMATLRTYDEGLLEKLKEKCIEIAERTAQTYDLSVDHEWVEPFPATVNTPEATEAIVTAAKKLDCEMYHKDHPFSWSEDFGHFTKEIGGAMFGLGIGENHPSLHAEDYDFEDDAISTGSTLFMQIIKDLTRRN
ncbi:amidohydrolase [Fodinibius halophilus]|uniref:Amidohydrolase n=1 Tax=Fodinibius halophilus TaxID=1736908 RepID=A0A6M1T7M8_9BACT|nr:amidohydrolase [Fodinibius halophilus]NGP90069.1 amidohydrolase [Fodinibius halophilus]